jgi:hypothetical protein
VTTRYEVKTELDFRNRLVAKFAIPRAKTFWNAGFSRMHDRSLYPEDDGMATLCRAVQDQMQIEPQRGDLGQFLVEWGLLEERLLGRARQITARNISGREAIQVLASKGRVPLDAAEELQAIRRVQNIAAHRPTDVDSRTVSESLGRLREVAKRLSSRALADDVTF